VFATFCALYHELVHIEGNHQDILAGSIESIASKSQMGIVHFSKSRPIFHTRFAHAIKVILLRQLLLSVVLWNLCKNWSVIFCHDVSLSDWLDGTQHYNVSIEISNDSRVAWVIEERHSRINSAANKCRWTCVVLILQLKLWYLVSVKLHNL
jgi:hypothetical protein